MEKNNKKREKKGKKSAAVTQPVSAGEASIAVLPFIDLSSEKDQEYFCDGLAEEVINALAKIEKLHVASRTSAYQFRDSKLDIRIIGKRLNVKTVLEGSIRKYRKKLRVSIQLTDVSDGFLLWSKQYESDLKNVFTIQEEISQEVVKSLKLSLLEDEDYNYSKQYTDDVDAYMEYLRGRFFWNKRTVKDIENSITNFKKAITIDPDYSLAYTGLSDSHIALGMYGAYTPHDVMPKAQKAVKYALQIDDLLAEAHISSGCIKSVYEWDWSGSEEEFKLGMKLNPSYQVGPQWYAINYLTPLGRHEEAREEIDRALQLDPVSPIINATSGLVYYFSRQYDEAIEQYKKTFELDPDFAIANFFLGQAYLQKLMLGEAVDFLTKAVKLHGQSMNMMSVYAYALAKAGRDDVAAKMVGKLHELAEERYVSAYDIAIAHLGVGDKDEAFKWLEKGVDEHAYLLVYLKVDPMLDCLRSDKRFGSLLEKIGLNS